jgi:hypothetical protein
VLLLECSFVGVGIASCRMILPRPAGKRKGRAAVPRWAREGRIQRDANVVNQDSEIAVHIRETRYGNRCGGPRAEKLHGVRATERVDPVHDLRRARGKPPGEFLGQKQMLGRARAAPLTDQASDSTIRGPAVLQGAHRLDELNQRAFVPEQRIHHDHRLDNVGSGHGHAHDLLKLPQPRDRRRNRRDWPRSAEECPFMMSPAVSRLVAQAGA